MSRLFFLLPLLVFAVLVGYFALGLTKDPSRLDDTVLIDQPIGDFKLVPVQGRADVLSLSDVKGQVSLVNFFGSWCIACLDEHPLLMELSAKNVVPIFGVDWDEQHPSDVVRWLDRHGDPYTKIGVDETGGTVVDWGLTGAPETFVVDKNGVIRYKFVGPISVQAWEMVIWPLIQKLRTEA